MISRKLDFDVLCAIEPDLRRYWEDNTHKFDFSNHHALIALTRTLIKIDLGYTIQLSEFQLCPNYFNRLDYVLFIEKLIFLTLNSTDAPVLGLDIGTSQSCIYPLLCTKYISNISKMIATDIIPDFIDAAESNVVSNNLSSLIELLVVDPKENSYLPLIKRRMCCKKIPFVFTMCNPPFFTSEVQMEKKRRKKVRHLKAETEGHSSELITTGGDYEFIMKLLRDSEVYSDSATWFTSLIGNHSTVQMLIPFLKVNESNLIYGIHRFKSGSFTTRWILFWTYKRELKPPPELFNYCNKTVSCKRFRQPIRLKYDGTFFIRSLILQKLFALPYISLQIRDVVIIELPGNVFSRAYRRSGTFKSDGSVYKFELSMESRTITWRLGLDYKIFESFCSIINSL